LTQSKQPVNRMDVDELADRLARGEVPESEREEQWKALLFVFVLPRAQRLEEQLGCESLVDAAIEVLPGRLASYRKDRGRFLAWLETTLRNLARDEIRRRSRWTNLNRAEEVPQSDKGGLAVERQQTDEERLARLLKALETLGQSPRSKRQRTDFHAMLLVSLRLAVVSRMKRLRKALVLWGQTRSELAAALLPWTEADERREIQAGWPSLGTVWETIAAGLDETDANPTDDRIVGWLDGLPGILGLSAEGWRQWRKRAVAAGIKRLGREAWLADVEPWLESRAARPGRRPVVTV
jgi:hypothetical protein